MRCIGPLKSPLSGDLFFRQKTRVQRLYSRFSLSIKSVFTPKQQSRGSAHSKAFAAQTHENRGRVPRFSYFKREKVSVWELSDVRVLRSQNTSCRKNVSFSTNKAKTLPISRKGQWSLRPDSNRRPAHYECAALPTEPRKQLLPLKREFSRSQLFQYSMVLKIRQDFFENFS